MIHNRQCGPRKTLLRVACANSHHGQVDVGSVQLQVDLPVNGRLAVLVEILSHLSRHCSENSKKKHSLAQINHKPDQPLY